MAGAGGGDSTAETAGGGPRDDTWPLLCSGGDSAVLPLNESLTRAGAALRQGPEEDFAPWGAGFSLADIRATADNFGANATEEPGSDTHVWMEVGWRCPTVGITAPPLLHRWG